MTAKNLRLVLAAVVSIYGVVSAAVTTNGLHLPPAVSAVLVAAAPIMLAVQHWLSDPSTGTPPSAAPDEPGPVPDPAPTDPPAPLSGNPAQPPAVVATQPAPVPPPEWSTMAATAPQTAAPASNLTPNPAPPAPRA
jgi:hypothetical protein